MKTTVLIENPILNSPFEMPKRHFKFDDDGITDEIAESRRPSSYFIPIAAPKKRSKQLTLETQWTADRAKENDDINFIRGRVDLWRHQGYPDITPITRSLLEYWQRQGRERRLFFCQIEALETLIYLTEAATPTFSTRCARRSTPPARRCPASPARWPPAAARPLSWP